MVWCWRAPVNHSCTTTRRPARTWRGGSETPSRTSNRSAPPPPTLHACH